MNFMEKSQMFWFEGTCYLYLLIYLFIYTVRDIYLKHLTFRKVSYVYLYEHIYRCIEMGR